MAAVRSDEDVPHRGRVRGGQQDAVRRGRVRREAPAVERGAVPPGERRVVLRAVHAHPQERRRFF